MNGLPILKARFLGYYLNLYFFSYVNDRYSPCNNQRQSMYGFHRSITPVGAQPNHPCPNGYYDYYNNVFAWGGNPPSTPLIPGFPTRFDDAIMYGL